MALKVKSLPAQSELCTTVFDKISVKECVTYYRTRDKVEDFEPEKTGSGYASIHAVVFMVKGLKENWKQPVGYFLSSGPIESEELACPKQTVHDSV
jgi:hypothetical protein